MWFLFMLWLLHFKTFFMCDLRQIIFNHLQSGPGYEKISLDNQRAWIAINFQNLIEVVGYSSMYLHHKVSLVYNIIYFGLKLNHNVSFKPSNIDCPFSLYRPISIDCPFSLLQTHLYWLLIISITSPLIFITHFHYYWPKNINYSFSLLLDH